MTAPNFGDKHPREELYWNGFEWVSFATFEKCRNEELERAEADAKTQDAIKEGVAGVQTVAINFPAGPVEFPHNFDAEALMLVVHDALQHRAAQVGARGIEEDRGWSPLDWKEMIDDYSAMARRAATLGKVESARERYLQVIALGIAAVEALDKNVAAARQAQPGSGRKFFGGEQP